MVDRLRVLLDLNVILDVLQRREPFYPASARLLTLAERGIIEACVAAHSLTTLYYLVAKDQSALRARAVLADLLHVVQVAGVDQQVIERALVLPYADFADAVQMSAAVHAGAGYLVSRNIHDFRAGPLAVLQPAEVLALLASEQ